MSILKGAMTVRRFRVLDPSLQDGWRDRFMDQLDAFAFKEPVVAQEKEPIEGWVQYTNFLETDFGNLNNWLFEPWAVFALRVDTKKMPAKLLRALLAKETSAWCSARNVERCPASVRAQMREAIESDFLRKQRAKSKVVEIAWNLDAGIVVVEGLSDSISDRVRKRFFHTFGYRLVPWSPLDLLADRLRQNKLLESLPSAFVGSL